MNWQIVLGVMGLAFSILTFVAVSSWRGGSWTGGERRHTEDLERRMEVANDTLSKLTSTVQSLMLIGKDVAVLQADHRAFEREQTRIDQRLTSLEHQK